MIIKMKTTVLICLMALVSLGASSQKLTVTGIEKLEVSGYHADFVPDTDEIVFTSKNFKGLKSFSLETGNEQTISDEFGVGYNRSLSPGKVEYSLKGQVEKMSYVLSSKSASAARQVTSKVSVQATRDLRAITVTDVNGERTLQPLGEADYLNIALSPDQSKLIFRVSGLGSYVTDLNGKVLQELGNVEFPKWIDDETVLYTHTKDDGHNYLSSQIVLKALNDSAKELILTDDQKYVALYPAVNVEGSKVLFHTPVGEVYLIQLDRIN